MIVTQEDKERFVKTTLRRVQRVWRGAGISEERIAELSKSVEADLWETANEVAENENEST